MKLSYNDDFYLAVNNKWLKKTKIPSYRPIVSSFELAHRKVTKLVEKEFKSKAIKNGGPILEEAYKFYAMAKNFKMRKNLGVDPLRKEVAKLQSLETFTDFDNYLPECILKGHFLPYEFEIMPSFYDSSKNILHFAWGHLILPDESYYHDDFPNRDKFLDVYKEMLAYFLDRLGLKNKSAIIENTINFDKMLAKISPTAVERSKYAEMSNLYKAEDFILYLGDFNILKAFEKLYNGKVESVNVLSPKFLEGFKTLAKKENFKMIRDWMTAKYILTNASLLDEESRVKAGTLNRLISGTQKAMKKEKHALDLTRNSFGMPIGIYYAKKYFGSEAKQEVERIVKNIIETYKKRLKVNDFLSESTKAKAILKLEKIVPNIGYPEKQKPFFEKFKVLDYSEGGNLVTNTESFTKLIAEDKISTYLKAPDKALWHMTPDTVNAYYSPNENVIVFPAAILVKPYFSLDQDTAENYGAIGAVIAHEISHAFDNNGAQFDENGNLNSWWEKADYEKFKVKTEEMIKLFDQVETEFGKCNGTLTVSENIADAGGIRCALECLKMENPESLKPFFFAWARSWRSKLKQGLAERLLKTDVHAPSVLRCNRQVMNMPEFKETFSIKPGDKMYLEPEKEVKIW